MSHNQNKNPHTVLQKKARFPHHVPELTNSANLAHPLFTTVTEFDLSIYFLTLLDKHQFFFLLNSGDLEILRLKYTSLKVPQITREELSMVSKDRGDYLKLVEVFNIYLLITFHVTHSSHMQTLKWCEIFAMKGSM